MRILYIDVDSLRPDHLGCYGYHRQTSPNIDALAARAGPRDSDGHAPRWLYQPGESLEKFSLCRAG